MQNNINRMQINCPPQIDVFKNFWAVSEVSYLKKCFRYNGIKYTNFITTVFL